MAAADLEGNCETSEFIRRFWKSALGLLKWGREVWVWEEEVKKSSEKYCGGHKTRCPGWRKGTLARQGMGAA